LEKATFVDNAGIVLTCPFLPSLWSRLGLLNGDNFTDEAAIERAAHVLDFLAFGDRQRSQPLSLLTRLLCGMPLTAPVTGLHQISVLEEEAIESLLSAVISHWKVLGNTSTAGLREGFLQRDGMIFQGEGRWNLQVHARSFDMLVDKLPWSISMCRHPWMTDTLHVEWR